MSSPTPLIKRNLTFNFDRAVKIVGGQSVPQTMEVSVTPLSSPSSPSSQLTLAGGVQEQTVLLNDTVNSVTFELVPSNAPGLTGTIQYLAAWRQGGVTGATEQQPFSMPDFDTDFDQLSDLGALLGGASFLQQSDLGVAGRVAKLNDAGQVTDSSGDPVAMPADVAAVTGQVNAEAIARQQADAANFTTLANSITQQTGLTLSAAKAYADAKTESLTATVGNEAGEREDADDALQDQITSLSTTLGGEISTLQTTVGGHTTTLAAKADLDNTSHVPLAQIPAAAITAWVPVANTTAMLALRYPQDVQPGDLAYTSTAIYGLLTTDPSQIGNWRALNTVVSVNGRTGAVSLTAADVGAVASSNGSILISQVTGLSTALTAKANQTDLTTAQAAITTIQSDPTYVHTSSGVVSNAVMPANVALISSAGNITKKDGTIVSIGEGSGVSSINGETGAVTLAAADVGALATNGTITEGQVTGLATDLAARVLSSDSRLTNTRTPTAHAATHAAAGSDPVTVTQAQVTGLPTTLTSHGNELSSLDTRVTTLEASGPGGYGAGTGIYFAGSAPTGDFIDNTTLHSPFGYNPTNPDANMAGYYFDPAGAAGADVVYPAFWVNGALAFNKWGIANTPDPYYAAANDLTTLAGVVAGSALQSDMTTLQTTVAGKADSSTVSALSTTVAGKADASVVTALSTTVAGKANSSDLSALSSTVAGKASATDMTTVQGQISTINSTLPTKADLQSGVLKTSQVPTGIPIANIAQLTAFLAHLSSAGLFDAAYLTNIANIVSGIPQSAISGLVAALASKASLDGSGKLLVSQLPALALTDTFVVSNQAAMLALSTAHQGDICVINAGANIGTYVLSAADPTQLSNWVALQFPTSTVSSVNGQTGTVVLAASDVGALATNAVIPISQVSGLQTTLNSLATTSALNTAVATLTTPAQVDNILTQSTMIKQAANFVATTAIASLSGQQSVDGVLTPVSSIVLATAQSSSVNNGLWVVNTGAWTRATDFATGTWLVRGTIVLVTQGNTNGDTVWQVTSSSGIIDTNVNSWLNIGNTAPPPVYTNGNGLNLSGLQFSVKPVSAGGISVTSSGVAVDNTVMRKFTAAVPSSGSTTVSVAHNLNNNRPICQLYDVASGNLVDIGWTVVDANHVTGELANPPSTGQWAVGVYG